MISNKRHNDSCPEKSSGAPPPIIEKFLSRAAATIERSHMLALGDRVLVAVSGGPDSVALWRTLVYLAPRWDLTLFMVHVNYHLRSRDSEADEAFCRRLARETGARLFVRSRRIRATSRSSNLQDWARRERYAIFASLSESQQIDRVAVGHHYDDQVETVAVGLLGGRRTFALGGIPRVRGRIIRPLFDCRRAEILDFLRAIRQPYREDQSNLDQRYLRNRVRHKILPEWREKFNPNIDQSLFQWAELASQQMDYLNASASRFIARAQVGWGKQWLALDIRRLQQFDRQLDFYILRQAAEQLNLPDISPGEQIVRRFGELVGNGSAGQKLLWDKAIIELGRSAINFYARKPVTPQPVDLDSAGSTFAANWRIRVKCRRRARKPGEKPNLPRNGWRFVGDANAIKPPLVLRGPRPGERIRPLGMAGRKKIYDILADAGVPGLLRPVMPVIEDRWGVVWVVGHRQDDRTRVRPQTNELLMINVEPDDGDA